MSGRTAVVLLLLLVFSCATTSHAAGESSLSWRTLSVPGDFMALDPVAPHTPVTLRAQYRFTSQESIDTLEGIWLAGLSVRPDAPPTFLSVVWSEITAGWFPSRGLQLQSDQGLFPNSLPVRQDSGFLAGSEYLNLFNHVPEVGQLLEVQLSYDPRSGAAALNILDATHGKSLHSAEYDLKPYDGVLYPMLGIVTDNPGIKVEHFSAVTHSVPVGVNWSFLIQNLDTQQYEPLYLVRVLHTSELALQLDAGRHTAGVFELVAEQADQTQSVLRIPATVELESTTHTFQAQSLPKGPITLRLQYLDPQGKTWLLGSSTLDVILGTIQVRFDPMEIEDQALRGMLRITADEGVVEQVRLRVTAHIKEFGQSVGSDVVVVDQPLERISTESLIVPYVVPFDKDSKFYELTFSVDFGAPVSAIESGNRFYVLW
jgi:hypothetical protein